jgi:cytidylate kinase
MAIVTIAHETGSGGPEIGIELAKRLGFRYVDRDMLSEAALRYGVGEDKLNELDEKKPSLFERFDVETRQFITVIQSALLDAAEEDNVVINSRGGQMLLRGISHVLRVYVIAPFELRVKRVMKKMTAQAESVDVRTTAEMVRRSDQEKHGRIRYLYDVNVGDPALYDLVLNTEKLSVEAGVGALAGLVRGLVTTEESRQQVRDRALGSRVRASLAAHPDTRKYRLSVEADRGVIRLEGTAALERATEVARTVPGVVDVKSQLLEVPPIPPFVA